MAGDLVLMMLLFAALAALAVRLDARQTQERQGVPTVADGDSLTLAGQRVRLRGIDAPEYGQTCRRAGADYPCGKLARQALVQAIAGQPVSCSGSRHDRYGRLLGDCRAGDVDLNRAMVASGWAVAYGDFTAEERAALAGLDRMRLFTNERLTRNIGLYAAYGYVERERRFHPKRDGWTVVYMEKDLSDKDPGER